MHAVLKPSTALMTSWEVVCLSEATALRFELIKDLQSM